MRLRLIASFLFGLFCFTLAGGALHAAEADSSPISFGFEGGFRYDSNIGFSPDDDDEFDVWTTQVSGGVDWTAVNTGEFELVFSGDGFYNYVSDLNDLTNYGLTGGIAFRNFFGTDLTSPYLGLDAEVTYIKFDDSDLREGYWTDWRFTLGKRLNQRWGVSVGARYFRRWQDNDTAGPEGTLLEDGDEVFDQQKAGGFAHIDFFAGADTTLFFEFTYFSGDVVATATVPSFGFPPVVEPGFTPIALDPAFGSDQFAWRLDADQYIVEGGLTHSFTDRLILNVNLEYIDADADFGNDYDNIGGEAMISFTF